jgi:acyl dehydratase
MTQEEQSKGVLTYEEAEIGFEFSPYVFEVTLDLVQRYAKLMGEDHPIFTDAGSARKEGYSDLVAIPTLMNCYAHFIAHIRASGYERPGESFHSRSAFKFLAPVYPGDVITSTMRVSDKWEKRGFQYLGFTIESRNQHGNKVAEKFHASVWPSERTERR